MPQDISAFYLLDHRLIALAMVALLLVSCEIGYRLGLARQGAPESLRGLMSATGAAMLGLLGLLLGFALSMAIARWDTRRDVIITESNAIATLWLRAGLLEDPPRRRLQEALGAYSGARIALGGSRSRPDELRKARRESEALHVAIWSAVEGANRPTMANATLAALISSANELIDLHELRLASIENHLPPALFLLLLALGALSVGFLAWSFGAASQRGRAPMLLLALLIGAVLLLIMDVNRPQRGMIDVGVAPLERVAAGLPAPTG
ncbi:MAG: DUF4239 domain-containing protein [Myxococcota bacterium]|nr:DUF4239 domain-containing protein [Myxococcota bacterium]